ncbi:hypothetical protein [Fimbriiglobus ruber]|uniref:Uncharacterized protein n=1 Tax=Fimbriiglobus ruber TaxID=1908690 RepID=A0A225E018_9BACT|nr:hypothetical protein [Fimbriiglobus ruber]OWK46941.1 hypothetical protein FRUB_00640 [Fimbriiglobus ruber]
MSFRGTAAALAVVAAAGPTTSGTDRTPSPTTVRSWVIRLGYAHLTRPLAHDHSWAWLIDHTLQIGHQKLFAIFGVPLDPVPFGVRPLPLADVHLLALVPMTTANRAQVATALTAAVARTGPPRQIVSDGATELRAGIQDFRIRYPDTAGVADVTHVAANLLKHYWEGDPQWTAFTRQMAATAATIRQTRSAHLMAPTLRARGRYRSVAAFIRFGRFVLRKLQAAEPDADIVTHYGWVTGYAAAMAVRADPHALAQATVRVVRVEGFGARTPALVAEAWEPLATRDHPTTERLRNRLRAHVGRETRAARPGERRVGSTEIVESAFGVLKRLSRDQSASGLTGLSVGLGAMIGTTTPEQIQADLERVPEKAVQTWAKQMFGSTVQWLRRKFFGTDPCPGKTVPDPG